MRFFLRSELSTECERCGSRIDLAHGGVCTRCKRILCFRHLHGSWLDRLKADFGVKSVCVDCRAGRSPSAQPGAKIASPRGGSRGAAS